MRCPPVADLFSHPNQFHASAMERRGLSYGICGGSISD